MRVVIFCQVILLIFLTLGSSADVRAQDEINRVEFFGGYSHNRIDAGLDSDDFDSQFGGRIGTNGVNLSLTGNISKYVGVKFDFAHHQKSDDISFEGFNFREKYTNQTYMGGIQIKNNKKDGPRIKPFFHALAGVSKQKFTVTESTEALDLAFSQTNFTFAVGGGVDIKATKHVDIRVFQVDYNPTYYKDQEFDDFIVNGRLQNNIRFSFGVVIH